MKLTPEQIRGKVRDIVWGHDRHQDIEAKTLKLIEEVTGETLEPLDRTRVVHGSMWDDKPVHGEGCIVLVRLGLSRPSVPSS